MKRLAVLFYGCGFLFSHTIPSVLPLLSKAVLVDREYVEPVNYENALLPRGFAGKRKTSAALALISMFSSVEVVVHSGSVDSPTALARLAEEHGVDLVYATVDNLEARRVALGAAGSLPVLMAGVTSGFGYVDWAERVELPREEEIAEQVRRVRDACTRLEFRPLGAVIGALAGASIYAYALSGTKIGYYVWERGGKLRIERVE